MLIKVYCDGCGGPFYEQPNGWSLISVGVKVEGDPPETMFIAEGELKCQTCGKAAWRGAPISAAS